MLRWKALVAVVALSACATVHAASVTITWNNPIFNPNPPVGVGTVTSPAGSVNTQAGRFQGVASNLNGINPGEFYLATNSVFAYCYDLAQTLSSGAAINYTVVPGASANTLDFLGAANAYLGGGAFGWLNPGSADVAAAIQIGIWKSLYDNLWTLGAGSVTFSGSLGAGVTTAYNAIVGLINSTDALDSSRVMVLVSDSRQDVITGRLNRLVPEPGSLALIGIAAAVAGLVRRKRR